MKRYIIELSRFFAFISFCQVLQQLTHIYTFLKKVIKIGCGIKNTNKTGILLSVILKNAKKKKACYQSCIIHGRHCNFVFFPACPENHTVKHANAEIKEKKKKRRHRWERRTPPITRKNPVTFLHDV